MASPEGLLFSQIGYDTGLPVKVIIRGGKDAIGEDDEWSLSDSEFEDLPAELAYWGEKWGSHWWLVDCGSYDEPASLLFEHERYAPTVLEVGPSVLFDETWRACSYDQAERRAKLAMNKIGWQDCGASWSEANSHAAYVLGLVDLLVLSRGTMSDEEAARVQAQVEVGCDYLLALQSRAKELHGLDGAVVHQLGKFEELVLPQDVSKAAYALARGARVASPDKVPVYLEAARKALAWLVTAKPLQNEHFCKINHGVSDDFVPPQEWFTRDLLMEAAACAELVLRGEDDFEPRAVDLIRQVMDRQILVRTKAGVFGHFRAFASTEFAEKAWIHHMNNGGAGGDLGGTFPHFLFPIAEMLAAKPDHADATRWRECLERFVDGYLLTACKDNPFGIVPLGDFGDQGLLYFAGLWHGMNSVYGITAALALDLADLLDRPELVPLAYDNLQWIAGLNSGLTESAQIGCEMTSRPLADDVAVPVSMICGFGDWAGTWLNVRGSICNGFATGRQFTFDVPSTAENDGPTSLTDEDWITHVGAWLSAVARLGTRG